MQDIIRKRGGHSGATLPKTSADVVANAVAPQELHVLQGRASRDVTALARFRRRVLEAPSILDA